MKKTNTLHIELLKEILSNLRAPDMLNDHPWKAPGTSKSSGEQLVQMVTDVFRKMMPPNPPRKGKRLDTRWGVFGILAAQYFAPFLRGESFPSSLRDAWESLDNSILFFVYGRIDGLTDLERATYRFTGNESQPSANSTLSDWQRKGIEQLAEMVNMEQKRLNTDHVPPPVKSSIVKQAVIAFSLLALFAITFLSWKAWNIYQHVLAIETKANALETYLIPTPDLEKLPEMASKVHELRVNLDTLETEVRPYLWTAPYLAWIPKYGGTVSQAEPVLALAQNLASAADEGLSAITPAIETALLNDQPLEVMDLLLKLQSASPQLLNAQISLAQAQEARKKIEAGMLIPRIKNIVEGKIDPLFNSLSGAFPMEDALSMVRIAPQLLGGGEAGPQTYLILMQNEDELRPTGGYLTAAGSAVVMDGKLISINIESSELVDDLSKPHPIPPWQFEEFMNIEMLLFRDSNWFTNFPTTASWAEYFYSYSKSTSANGVIAMDTHMIVRLLETLGPVRVDNVSFPITHENVLDYMRSAKETRPKGVTGKWDRKQFISKLAKPLLEKILNARGQIWTKLMPVMLELLDEKHLLLQFDNEEAGKFLERRNWDGSVRIPQNSDYLMTVDANMGYNKSNAVMEMLFKYNLNLTVPTAPSGRLQIEQINHSKLSVLCEPFFTSRFLLPVNQPEQIPDAVYNIDECHWGYLRIYTPKGTELLHSNPREIPAEATMLGETIPARTDDLGSEDISGAQVFGMMVITPTRQSTNTIFEYNLPANVVTWDDENQSWTYRLKVQKQPGMVSQPFVLTVNLPSGVRIKSANIPLTENADAWTARLELRNDLTIEVIFSGE
ncbi:DUF4012 domain-containing protein [Candidatus Villigracilis saccharophilus]|uniref:DUF4012 domain-containing protein n=1 Tax=Candidatus Villigracilis saccharophilus TaxID=3140684 RepID=UPI003134FF5B|nr:DUF4012 domain-containing protein [Anaerolineales bacterium]